ncbi:MAG: Holliday junction branch migration protein RuvA, partial [Brachybacterium sp.]|nr:Holliday junction branch migration protein RuvA [Brachybacterium sp.]
GVLLGGKLPAPSTPVSGTAQSAAAVVAAGGPDADVVEALVGLGWAEKAALGAVESVRADGGEDLDAAELLRRSLRGLGGHR